MNFIAHLHLSHPDPPLMVGNFIADFISKRVADALPIRYARGVRQHRQIDSFTDNHPAVKTSLQRLYPGQGKYALVVIDVYYDNLLTNSWHRYHPHSFDQFCRYVYDTFQSELPGLPAMARVPVARLLEHRWLGTYSTMRGLEDVFRRLKNRTRFPSKLESAASFLERHRGEFEEDFHNFYPDLIRYVDGGAGLSLEIET